MVRNFLEALGSISFAAQVLWFLKPFLGPLFAWVSNMPRGAMVTLPPMIRMILTWLQRQFDAGMRATFGVKTVRLGEIYRLTRKLRVSS